MVLHLLVRSVRVLTGPFSFYHPFLPQTRTSFQSLFSLSHTPSHAYGSVSLRRPLDVLRLKKNSLRPLSPLVLGIFFSPPLFIYFFLSCSSQ
ncbi:hypothetical protein BDV26DRAFT_144519 [Aspergillus bertholletiae]|uniref:Uncharacterized protein n=1 Tax=Aspergillus bertholletiae TaxID=1226010 RepID=A0A5N7AMR6_9EURO|nr:hypothetical protein BDV26DRAFT_144519 [Aspergillus bertholletiae]